MTNQHLSFMKNFAAFLLFCMASMGLWAAESSEKNWSLYKAVDGVEIYFQELSCDDPANGLFEVYTIFKIVNTNEIHTEKDIDLILLLFLYLFWRKVGLVVIETKLKNTVLTMNNIIDPAIVIWSIFI